MNKHCVPAAFQAFKIMDIASDFAMGANGTREREFLVDG